MRDDRVYGTTLQTRGLFCFDPATILRLYCLALTFVFFGTVGAVAQIAVPGPDQTVASGAMVVLDGSASTASPGNTVTTYKWLESPTDAGCSTAPDYETSGSQLTFTAETLAPGAADVTYCFVLSVRQDNRVGTAYAGPLRVTVTSPFAAPVAHAGGERVASSGTNVLLFGRDSPDRRRSITSYAWTRTGGTGDSGVVLSSEDTARSSFRAETLTDGAEDVTHIFELTVTDSAGETDTDTSTVTVFSGVADPVADAGDDRDGVASGTTVTLDGRGSTGDHRSSIASYTWVRTSGTGGSLTDADKALARFAAPALTPGAPDAPHVFELTVTDGAGGSDTDTVTITVTAPFAAPVAEAGLAQTVFSGATVMLDGSGSTADRRRSIASYAWTRTSGTGGSLTGEDTVSPSFTAQTLAEGAADATHVFTLTVTDDLGQTDTDTVMVTVTLNPIADAGMDRSVASGAMVELDGSGSTHDRRRTISYAWERTDGTGEDTVTLTLTGANTATPGFTAEALTPGAADATHVFELTVTDSEGGSDTDTVTITVTSPFAAPVAHAGGERVASSGTNVLLFGRGSPDRRRSITSYAWTRTGGTGDSGVVLSSEDTARSSFRAETLTDGAEDVTHIFELTVTDSAGETDTDTSTITVFSGVADPVADAGDDRDGVASGTTVTLDGRGSTADHRWSIASYTWVRTNGTGGSLTDADKALARFAAPALTPGAPDAPHVFELTVTDGAGRSDTDTVTITVTAPFAAPVAEAGLAQTVFSGATVMLDGSGSTADRRRSIASYAWTRTSGTGGSLTGEDTVSPSFTAQTLAEGAADATHVFTLTVTDDLGQTDTDTVMVTAGLSHALTEVQYF